MGRGSRLGAATAALGVAILLFGVPVPASSAPFPPLPLGSDGAFVTQLAAPVLAPGGSGSVSLVFSDPLATDLDGVTLTIAVYGFNAYPGNATGSVPAGALSLGNGAGATSTSSLGTVVRGAPVPIQVPLAVSGAAPEGTYALRLVIDFTANGSAYRLASRGAFSESEWLAATTGPNGTSTLNLTTLGVSGIVPETAVLVRANPYPIALTVILGAALVLAGAGGYYAFRRAPRSRSGATTPEDPSQAPTALGKSRSRDGD